MRILIDIDDVLADLVSEWINRYNKLYNDHLKREDIQDWDITKYVLPACGMQIFDILNDHTLYKSVQPIPGAVDGVTDLLSLGHEVAFVTSNLYPVMSIAKFEWLFEYGFIDGVSGTDVYINTGDKTKVPGDLIIDDKPSTVNNYPGAAILFDRPHNQNVELKSHVIRAVGDPSPWGAVVDIVKHMSIKQPSGIPGVGKDAPTTVNSNGGKQSALKYAFHLIDPLPMFALANILYEGAEKYARWNWRRIPLDENLNHALSHIFAYMAGDRQDDHLGHAFCRLMFAKSLEMTPGESDRMLPEG